MKENDESGMSLIEITIAILMLCALAAVAVPNVTLAKSSHQLRLAADGISQQLYLCRGRALAANQTCSIQIDATTGVAQIDSNFDGRFGDTGGDGLPADEAGTLLSLSDVTVVSVDAPISRSFTSRGEVPWQDNPEDRSITLIHRGLKRVVTIEQRGSIIVGEETAADY